MQLNPAAGHRLGRPRLLIVGCGDVGMRLLPLVRTRFRVFAVTSRPERCAALRAAGATPIVADLDAPHTLARLARLAAVVVHLAPPPGDGAHDARSRRLAAILPERTTLVYVSTSGVYGDCGGAWVEETRPPAPQTARARRRLDAERVWRAWARRRAGRLTILRVPGIYAADRLPLDRLRRGVPALAAADDVYTNHIHADDLARIIAVAIFRGRPGRVYHAADDTQLRMGEYFDAVADACGLARPPRLPRAELRQAVTPAQWSFMAESRRLSNRRIKEEWGMRLDYPRVQAALAKIAANGVVA